MDARSAVGDALTANFKMFHLRGRPTRILTLGLLYMSPEMRILVSSQRVILCSCTSLQSMYSFLRESVIFYLPRIYPHVHPNSYRGSGACLYIIVSIGPVAPSCSVSFVSYVPVHPSRSSPPSFSG